MNCNVAWYLQSGDCAPLWVQIIFYIAAILTGILWADMWTTRWITRKVMFLFILVWLIWFYLDVTRKPKHDKEGQQGG